MTEFFGTVMTEKKHKLKYEEFGHNRPQKTQNDLASRRTYLAILRINPVQAQILREQERSTELQR